MNSGGAECELRVDADLTLSQQQLSFVPGLMNQRPIFEQAVQRRQVHHRLLPADTNYNRV